MANIQGSHCSRTSPALCRPQEDVTLRLCCNRSQRPKFQCLILDGGQTPGWYEAEALISLGACTTPNISAQHSGAGACFLSAILQENVPENRLQIFFEGKPDEATRNILKENSFRWSPKAGAWQRQLNDNTFWVVDRISFLRPLSGEKPSELQAKARQAQEKPSIRAQLKAAKEGQQPKAHTKDKSRDLEV